MRRVLATLALVGILFASLPHAAAADGVPAWLEAESGAIATVRRQLRRRGFEPDVTAGPMVALPPGQVSLLDFGPDEASELLETGLQPDAWLVETNAGRWWLWETGATAPADRAAERPRDQTPRRALS